jgi:chemotaxis protein CheD
MDTHLTHFLYPGCIIAPKEAFAVKTILGSCVSVCLWDTVLLRGGLNHFLLPLWNGNNLPSPKYGNIAIERLLEKMQQNGCQKRNLVAKVFGGSQHFTTDNKQMNIGQHNISIAKETLLEHRIPIVSEDTGGRHGRLIIFYTDRGQVLLKTIQNTMPDNQRFFKAG